MIQKINPTLNLPFASMGQENSNDAFQNMGGIVTNSNGTRVNEKGLIETVPDNTLRVDYDPVTGECKGLLIEEERTNTWTYSDVFDNTEWTKYGVTLTPNTDIAPNGSTEMDTLVGANSIVYNGNVLRRLTNITGSATVSIYAKSKGATSFKMYFRDGTTGVTQSETFTLTSVTQRYSFSFTVVNIGYWFIGATNGDMAIWGAQLEAGSFSTSYIPTAGTAVTRTADNVSIGGQGFLDFYNQSEGSWLVKVFNGIHSSTIFDVDSPTLDRFPQLGIHNSTYIFSAFYSANYFSIPEIVEGDLLKIGLSVKNISQRNFYNGEFKKEYIRSMPMDSNILYIGDRDVGSATLNGHLKSLIYYPVALPDSQMIQLTRND